MISNLGFWHNRASYCRNCVERGYENLVHHLLKDNLECLYCTHTTPKKDWYSEWNKDHHYKSFICENCGRKNFTPVHFQGSGHDSFGELEKRLKQV